MSKNGEKTIPDWDKFDEEDFTDEDDDYEEEYIDRCDYCFNYSYICGEPHICENPHGEEVKSGVMYYKNHICDSCCDGRIEYGDSECCGCEIFEKKYPKIRFRQVKREFEKKGLNFMTEEPISFKSQDQKWEYHLIKLPDTFHAEDLIEANLSDFKIILRRYEDAILMFKDNIFGIHLDKFDKFRRTPFELSKIYLNEKIIEKKEKQFIKKDLILKFVNIDFGDYMPEYAIFPMYVFKDDYDYSIAEYILDKNKIRFAKFEDQAGDSRKIKQLKLFFAQMKIKPDDLNKEGSFKKELLPKIEGMVRDNLQKAQQVSANFILFPEYSIPRTLIEFLREYSKKNKIWIIGGAERIDYISKDRSISTHKWQNVVFIFGPNKWTIQAKFKPGKEEPKLYPGKDLIICESDYGIFAILNCADFLEDDLLIRLKNRVDFLLVPSMNKDVSSFISQANIACIKNSCYIMINNTLIYSGCSVFAPLHGTRRIFNAGEGAITFIEIDINEYHLHRTGKKTNNEKFKAILKDTNLTQQIK